MPFYGPGYAGSGWSNFTNANNFTVGCKLDGISTSCDRVRSAIANGAASIEVLSTTGTLATLFNAGFGGLVSAQVTSTTRWRPRTIPKPTEPPTPKRNLPPDPYTPLENDISGYFETTWKIDYPLIAAFAAEPHNSVTQGQGNASGGTIHPCAGAPVLDFSQEHFTERHILPQPYPERSKYVFYGGIGSRLNAERDPEKRLAIAVEAVKDLNRETRILGGMYQATPTSNIVFVFGFPVIGSQQQFLSVETIVGQVGKGLPYDGQLTNVNTLVLKPDCKTVITSYPGLPTGAYNYSGFPRHFRTPHWWERYIYGP